MNDVKSILISVDTHDVMKKFSKQSGMKIKFIAEEAIKEFIEKRSDYGEQGNTEDDLQVRRERGA